MGDTENTGGEGENANGGEEQKELTEDEQKAIALDWFLAMWDEALKRGVGIETLCIIALSATTSKLVDQFGDDQTAELLKSVSKNVQDGKFAPVPAPEGEPES